MGKTMKVELNQVKMAVVFPGQGNLCLGLGRSLIKSFPEARQRLDQFSKITDTDLYQLHAYKSDVFETGPFENKRRGCIMKKIISLVIIFLALFYIPAPVWAENKDIILLVEKFLAESKAPGVQISIVQKGDSLPLTISRGTACVENDVAMNNQTVMKFGSVTKLFTATRIKMLIQEGKLNYNTPISQFFPDLPGGDKITIRHLLTHTSGLYEMLMLKPFRENMSKPWTPTEIIDLVAKEPPLFAPGTNQKYCNSGYLILGKIVEIITKEPFGKQIVETILDPLGMTRTQEGNDVSIVKDRSCGYSADKSGQLIKPMMASMIPPFATGNFIGTSQDMIRFYYQGKILIENFIDTPIIDPLVLDNGKTAFKSEHFLDLSFDTSYLNGFTLFKFHDRDGLALIGKAGMFPGFASWFLYDPESGTAVAVTTNLETQSMTAMQLAVRIFEYTRKR